MGLERRLRLSKGATSLVPLGQELIETLAGFRLEFAQLGLGRVCERRFSGFVLGLGIRGRGLLAPGFSRRILVLGS
jgi:hypothetical protein